MPRHINIRAKKHTEHNMNKNKLNTGLTTFKYISHYKLEDRFNLTRHYGKGVDFTYKGPKVTLRRKDIFFLKNGLYVRVYQERSFISSILCQY